MKFQTLFRIASYLMLLTAFFHSLSFFAEPVAANETEKTLIDLMKTYKRDLGAGFMHTTNEIMISFSACFTLICLFGGLMNLYLISKIQERSILNGILNINLLVFGILFVVMAAFTFLPPILCTGLIFLMLIISKIGLKKQ
jgi:hypothetical protein